VRLAEQKRSPAIQTALIGLIGSVLTVIGGLCGATVASITTIYELERQNQHIALAAPTGGQSLSIDTGSIFISRQDASALDPSTYYVDFEHGFVLHRPLSGWDALEEMTVEEQLAKENVTCQAVCDQPVFRIRYREPIEIESDRQTDDQPVHRIRNAEPVMVQFIEGSTENGIQVDPTQLESDTLAYYSQMTILALTKDKAQDFTLYELALKWGILHQGGVNNIVANRDSQYVVEQVS